ncbi:MAG TPA: DNA-binding response regulator [Vineibacter sp.]|nr:DNA-binding response regulator [Vineibacter sp.]
MSSRAGACDTDGDAATAFTVLLVDDDPELLDEMSTTLAREGFSVLQASDGATAIEHFALDPTIAVLVSDVRMPGLDGLQLVETLRARLPADQPGPQVVFLTGHGTMDYAVHALRLRADDFLCKPMSRATLVAAVRRAMAASLRARDPAGMAAEPATLPQTGATVTRLFAGDGRSGIAAPRRAPTQPTAQSTPLDRPGRIRAMLRERKMRTRVFDTSTLIDPSWDMLLDLMLAHIENRQTYLFSLCAASGLPVTNTKRRLEQLVAAGLVRREDDPTDRRRVLVSLTDSGIQRLSVYLEQIERDGARRGRS